MKRRKPIVRNAPPKRSGKPIRARRPKAKRRFADKRDEAYTRWIAKQPCILKDRPRHTCYGRVQCCHVKSRGAGGEDRGNCFPCCACGHEVQHYMGIKSFQAFFGVDLAFITADLLCRWRNEFGEAA